MGFRFAASIAVVGLALFVSERARAACVDGQKVTTDCQIDLVTSPVLSSNRVVALGGAYQAIAAGLDGYPQNAAAPAVRDPYSHKWLDYDLDASISFPSAFRSIDFENRGFVTGFTYNDFVFLTLGANLQLGAWGFGVFSDLQLYNLTPNADATTPSYSALVSKTHALVARQLFGGNLVVGLGLRIVGFSMSRKGGGQPDATVVSLSGAGPEIGFLWRPNRESFRIGATYRAKVTGNPGPNDATVVNGSVIPHAANLPWEIDAGIALQAGPRPLNDKWINPHDVEQDVREGIRRARERRIADRQSILAATPADERAAKAKELDDMDEDLRAREDRELRDFQGAWYAKRKLRWESMPRDYLLFSLGMLVVGPTDDGISLESFFSQTVTRAGKLTTFSPRAGLETEIVPDYVKARLGGYVEPTRFGSQPDAKAFRQHVTFGGDVYLFRWTVFGLFEDGTAWRLTTAFDLAPRYQSYGLSIGNWH